VYCEPVRPLITVEASLSQQQEHDDLLDIADVLGKRIITTRLRNSVTVREENSIAALEVMSRFAVNPKWLIYLPPTMSPSETTEQPGLLEHPAEAFKYYRQAGVSKVVCEEKHMGSRAVVVLCRSKEVARTRFGLADTAAGICYTRTGRRFFDNRELEGQFLGAIRAAAGRANLWDELETDWMCLDCELMPWSMKAQELLKSQYAAVGAAASLSLPMAVSALETAAGRGIDTAAVAAQFQGRQTALERYTAAYRRYCWPVASLGDIKLAPFHILATEGRTHTERDHVWHMDTLARMAAAGEGMIIATPYKVIDLENETSVAEGIGWWEQLTQAGGEGMVVKPFDFTVRGDRGLLQPAVKCRGPEYLRIIYGPEYLEPANLERLRSRGVSRKRSLALREYALGIEALSRFARRDPLRRVHECVFGVLALESEPVDPRL